MFIGYASTSNFFKNTPLRVVFSTPFLVFGYPDETPSLVFDILHSYYIKHWVFIPDFLKQFSFLFKGLSQPVWMLNRNSKEWRIVHFLAHSLRLYLHVNASRVNSANAQWKSKRKQVKGDLSAIFEKDFNCVPISSVFLACFCALHVNGACSCSCIWVACANQA